VSFYGEPVYEQGVAQNLLQRNAELTEQLAAANAATAQMTTAAVEADRQAGHWRQQAEANLAADRAHLAEAARAAATLQVRAEPNHRQYKLPRLRDSPGPARRSWRGSTGN
jgi:hypothetical protein